MLGFGKTLALTVSFFLTLSTSTLPSVKRPVFAQEEYYFQEEFNDERVNNTLDSLKWIFFPNNQTCALATIKESSGFMNLQQCNSKPRFPYVYTKNNPFPEGNFEIEIKFQYTKVTPWGTGFAIVDQVPQNGQWISDYLFSIGTWQDKSLFNMRISFDGNDIYTSPTNLNPHLIKINRTGKIYKIYLDNNLIFTSPEISIPPKAVWFGNPGLQLSNIPEWTNFKIDYIRIKETLPEAPEPFLDLPWDYGANNMSFNEAATSINAYFDHEYPLLSSGLTEPQNVISYRGGESSAELDYSSHDGYDYGTPAKVNLGKSVLAAADGTATYMSSCTACGNAILIDHGNGYQTRYYHMQKDGLVVGVPGESVEVTKGEEIGKVGFSGNVSPSGEAGSHLHFMVIQDKDGDGDFSDNIPDGMTDPFGWQSTDSDPWENYTFEQGEDKKTGNKSYYLFSKKLDNLNANLTSDAAVFEVGKTKLDFPAGTTNENLSLKVNSAPNFIDFSGLNSLGSIILVEAKNQAGQFITNFAKNFGITINFSQFDLSRFNLETLSIYSSPDGVNWIKEPTQIDLNNKNATASVNHLTYFALMAERKDTIAPVTTPVLEGQQGAGNNFRSDVKVNLNSLDNEGGLGVEFTAYSIGEAEWQTYTTPLIFPAEGAHKVYFYSQDNDGNIEDIKSVEFSIDKTIPEAKVFIDPDQTDLVVEGINENPTTLLRQDNLETNKKDGAVYTITDLAGNTLILDVRDRDKDAQDSFKLYSLKYNEDSQIILDQNQFSVSYKGKKERSNIEEQSFKIKDEVKIKIKYDSKKDESTLSTKESGEEKVKEIKNGLSLLWLNTAKGKLEYGY